MSKLQFLNCSIILVTFLNCCFVNGQTIYNEQNNPAVWGGACQNGTKQSPINLVINKAIYLDMNQLALNYQQYDIPLGNVTLTNDGLSVVVDFQKSQNFMPGVRYLGKQYLLDSFHFHWGGSEHEFNGKRLDGEIHLVHLSKQEEILVLGALLQKTDSSNNAISNIFRTSAQNIQNFNTTTTLDFSSTSLRDVLQNVNLLKYLTYEGSLTTPNCNEGVRWIVYRDIIQVDGQAIEGLKQLKNQKNNNILFNFRNIQPLNGRTIYKTFFQ